MRFEVSLDTDVSLSAGMHPVKLILHHLDYSCSFNTGVECSSACWDNNLCRITSDDSMWIIKNEEIEASKRRIAGQIQQHIDNCILDFLHKQSSSPKDESRDLTFAGLIDAKISTLKSLNTKRGYECFKRYFSSAFGEVKISNIEKQFASKVISRIENDFKDKRASARLMTARFCGVWRFGDSRNLLGDSLPAVKYHYVSATNNRDISIDSVSRLYSMFLKKISDDNDIHDIRTMAMSIFFLDLAFQGLSPVDLAELKVGDIKRETVRLDSTECVRVVKISTSRKKTGRPVKIVAWEKPIRRVLEILERNKTEKDYLLPCYNNKVYVEEKRQNRLCNFFNMMAKALNLTIEEDARVKEELSGRRITYYFARHAFCNIVDSLDIPRNVIQTMIGHKTTVLERSYLRPADDRMQASVSCKIFQLLENG